MTLAAVFCPGIARAQTAPSASNNSDQDQAIRLPSFQVSETQDQGYKASNAVSGTGFSEKIVNLPFSLTALTSQFISDIGAADLIDAASTVAGVRSAAHEYITGEDGISIRGFIQYPERNGIYEGNQGDINVDPIVLERVEVAKGPSSLLYGAVSPGGTVNYITKTPQDTPSAAVSFAGGSFNYYRATLDVNQPLIPDVLLFRMVGAYTNNFESQVVGDDKSIVLAPQMTWNVAKNLSVRVGFQDFDRDARPPVNHLPFMIITTPQGIVNVFNKALGYPTLPDAVSGKIGTNLSPYGSVDVTNGYTDGSSYYTDAPFLLPGRSNYNYASQNDYTLTTLRSFDTEMNLANIGEHWNARAVFDYSKNNVLMNQTGSATIAIAPANSLVFTNGAWALAPAYAALTAAQQLQYNANFVTTLHQNPGSELQQLQNGTAPPIVQSNPEKLQGIWGDDYTIQVEGVGSYKFPFGTIRPLVGAYYNRDVIVNFTFSAAGNAAQPNFAPWDVDPSSPTYYINRNNPTASQVTTTETTSTLAYDFTRAAYAVLNASLFDDRLQVVGGARYNSSGLQSVNYLGTTAAAVYAQGLTSHVTTPQVGVGYKVTPNVMLYGSFSESYTLPGGPNAGATLLTAIGYNANNTPVAVPIGPAKPITGQGTEVGIKTDLLDGRLTQTVSIFQITQSDVFNSTSANVTGPTGVNATVVLNFQGTVIRNDGVEYEMTYSPIDKLQMIFNVSDENIRNIAEPTGYIYFLGAPPYDSSRYLSHLWARYQITPHFWLAGGYNYESKYLGNGTSLYLWLPEQLEWDAAGGYNWKWGRQSYSLTVNFQNIGNSLIREALAEEPWPRRVFAGLTVKF